MDLNVKKLVKDAGAALSRVVQLTEETLGTSEKTELDAHLEHLADRANATKTWTEKILRNMEAVLTPNPGNRIEDFFYEKIDKKKPNRLSNLEYVGMDMIEAGNDFGPGIAYGSALNKVGQCQQKLGQIQRNFIKDSANCYIQPLRKFLEGEMKTVTKEMSILENKRLDLDSCKNRVRKARSMLGQQSETGVSPEVLLDQAERELRIAQSEFDRQAEIVKLLLEGVQSSQAGHLRCLHEFVEAQARYYAQCHATMQDLQRELAGLSGGPYHPTTQSTSNVSGNDDEQLARVLCDFSATNSEELSVVQNEVITVIEIPGNEEYVIGISGIRRGKIPAAYLELIDVGQRKFSQ
ncbi:endophilin-B1 isoform X1 [Bombus vosnesenskii]|uniref:Endophilin-B1 isoform X1 n=7 Tax=Bombus TaxID=28641 RepID=A0A6J3LKZ7_9HYME|nr:endophilin-B1 isoform X1 [Bombus impatiens]XP_033186827.1 endophilin-B1 isoform X1 [Bombus vancouverensis nearcticus]XP_033320651.1 endophilin-B1 isoform X1 [Bombus bifarius]XP_033366067.1 endophilin-B1 isoform X1 [Bombus vosnesenskii]XP_050490269.1 endophilin-B1 isoform X1 [Bombus huntii]